MAGAVPEDMSSEDADNSDRDYGPPDPHDDDDFGHGGGGAPAQARPLDPLARFIQELEDLSSKNLGPPANLLTNQGVRDRSLRPHRKGAAQGRNRTRNQTITSRARYQLHHAIPVDLVKAFDSVPRDGLYAVLEKFGVPPKFCSIIVALHEDLVVKATVGNVEVCVESTVGVKQGCTLAPILFLIYMQAGIELVNKESTVTPLVFKTRDDNIISGRNIKSDTGCPLEVVFSSSFFADDGAFLFESRRDLQEGMELVYRALGRLGMRCHIGRNGAMSKTEAMYFPPPKSAYDQADTTPLNIDGGHVHFTKRFKYLGSILSSNLKDDDEIDARIKAGSAAFASVRKQFFGSRQIRAAHKRSCL